MNKVFKVIWSEARNAYVVVSEMAKSHGTKSCSTKKLLAMLIATGVMTCASVAPVMAAPTVDDSAKVNVGKKAEVNVGENAKVNVNKNAELTLNNGAKVKLGEDAKVEVDKIVAIGNAVSATGGDSVAVGGNTQATGTFSVALGQTAKALEAEGIAIGHTSLSEGSCAIAIGKNTNAKGAASLALGNDAKALEEASIAFGQGSKSNGNASIAVGRQAKATGANSIAIGNQAVAAQDNSVVIGAHTYNKTTGTGVTGVGEQTQVLGDYSAAFGMKASANKSFTSAIGSSAKATADCANAFGSNSTASAVWSVALGTNSVADRTSGYVGLYAPEDTNSLTWRANGGAVSVGSNGTLTRQITNVAAGTEDTDAVNVAQLNAVKAAAGKKVSLVDGENTKATLVKDDDTGTQYKVDVDLSKYAKTEDVAVVYVDNNKNKSLHTTNSGAVGSNAIALGKGASAVKDGGVALGNEAYAGNKGTSLGTKAKSGREGATVVGYNTNSSGLYSTVVGTDATINTNGKTVYTKIVQGAAATVVGAMNKIDNTNGEGYSGVANNVMGAANTIEGSNGVTIQGSGNTVTDAYKDMDITDADGWAILRGDYSVLAKKQSGAIAVVGGANTVSKQTDSTVIGYGNQLAGGAENISHDVFLAGSHNKLNNVSDSIVMGNENAITGVSNVISFGHQNAISADNAVAIGSGAGVSAEGGVALGVGSVASTAAGALGYGADGKTDATWQATKGAVSVGGNGVTRQITNVAAGTEDTDAVNVAQLKKVSDTANAGWNLYTNGVATNATNVQPGDYVDFSGDKNISVSHDRTKVKVELNDELKDIKSIIGAGEGAGSISFADGGKVKVNDVIIEKGGKITGVAAGTADTDAVNYGQLKDVKAEAGKHTTLSNGKNTTVESTVKDGQTDYKVNVAGDLTDITSVANGDSKINLNKDSIIISNGNKYFAITNSGIGMSYIGADYSAKSIMLGENGTTISGGLNVAGSKITGVAAGEADTDAVNVGQLNAAVQAGNTDTHIKAGEYGVGPDNKVNMQLVDKNGKDAGTVTITDVAKASDVGNVNDIADDLKNGGEGKTTVVEAVNNLNNKLDTKVGDLQYSKVGKGDIADGDSTTTAIGKLDQKLTDVAATAAKHTKVEGSSNIIVTNTAQEGEAANYEVKLNKDIDVDTVKANSVTTGDGDTVMNNDGLKVGDKVSVTATAVTAGKTSISDEGVKVGDKTYINDKGLNANGQNITNVADGKVEKDSKDAINGGQLHQVKADIKNRIDGVENQVISNSNRINQLGNRVNKVGAGAAALAALHPMDFDPDDKLTFSAGYGNYGGENAAAIGAYYRPDEKVMFSVAGTVGNGENMVNAGVSFALDRTNHVSNSRTALAREVIDLRGQLAVMGAKMAKMEKAFGMLDETKTKLFPDVPANHWAYEYIAKLAGNGYIEGYPDGNFGGDRLMTRYEFAAMLYRAIEKGAALEEKIIKEFEPELGRIRVDRISGEDGDSDKIERVRVNDTKGERDHYGNKLAK